MPAGRLADLYGRKRIFYLGLVTYIVFSILCGFSQSAIMLYVIRAFHGLASALIVPAASGMIGAIYHDRPRRRGHAFSLLGAFISGGFLTGVAVGGLTAELLTWRWLFWIMAILAALTVVSALLSLPKPASDSQDEAAPSPFPSESTSTFSRLDLIGLALSVSFVVLFTFGLTYSANAGWASPAVLVPLIISVVAIFPAFVYWERHTRFPLIPLDIFKIRNVNITLAIVFFAWSDFEVLTLYFILFWQNVQMKPPLLCTAYFVPDVITGVVVSVMLSFVITRVASRTLLLIGQLCMLAGPLLFIWQTPETPYWNMALPGIILSACGGISLYTLSVIIISAAVSKADQSSAQGMFQTVTQLAIAVGLAIASAVEHKAQGDGSLEAGYKGVFWLCVGLIAVALVFVAFLTPHDRHRQ